MENETNLSMRDKPRFLTIFIFVILSSLSKTTSNRPMEIMQFVALFTCNTKLLHVICLAQNKINGYW